jgi:hypothetical protein
MDISFYLLELLDDQDYVVVPGLGAFLTSYHPSVFSKDESLLSPPSRMIAFYPEMKSNDGILAGIIAQYQKITLPQATRLLDKFTGDILYRTEKGEKVTIGLLGSLYMEDGELLFKPGSDSLQLPEAFGLSPVVIREDLKTTVQPDLFMKSENRRRIPVWIAATAILVLAGIITALWLILSNKKQKEPTLSQLPVNTTQPIQEVLTPVQSDTTDQQNAQAESLETDKGSVAPFHSHPRRDLYYTIGGSFRSESNALEYSNKMTGLGFHPIQLGKVGDFYLVALDTFHTASEAFEAADQYAPVLRKTEIWVYHIK